ncbi:unnamed protein product [Effrenium voratum]|nr:unnamed protein product [Effrenium voratum]
MSWFSGSSSSWGASLFTSTVDTTQRKEDKPMPKVAAKSLMRDWEVQCYGTADDNENVEKPTWDPFLSLEESEAFEKRMSTMRQMRDIGELGETSGLKSYEQQVLGAHHTHTKSKTKKMPASEGDTGPTVVEDEDQLVGMDKVIDGQTLSVAVPWSLWPQQTTEWKNADSYATLIPDTESFGIAFYVKDKPPMYYEAACELELSRGLDSPGSAGMCFHLKPGRGNAGMRSYIFYLQFLEGEDDSAKLVVAKLSGQSSREMPETLRDLKEVNCTDGWHYFRVRSFHGGLMFYFDFQYVGFMEVGDDSLARRGLLGVWAWDMEVNVRKAVVRNLEDMDVVDHGDSEREEAIKAAQREHRVLMFRKARAARLIQTAVRVAIRSRRERMAPYLEFEGAEMLAARKRVLLAAAPKKNCSPGVRRLLKEKAGGLEPNRCRRLLPDARFDPPGGLG